MRRASTVMDSRRLRACALLIPLVGALALPFFFLSPADAQVQRWDCSTGSCRLVTVTGPAPALPLGTGTLPGTPANQTGSLPLGNLFPGLGGQTPSSCPGGACTPGSLGSPFGTTTSGPLNSLFRPGQPLGNQLFSFFSGLLRTPAIMATILIPALSQQLIGGLFGKGEPDITEVSPSDPRGQQVIRRQVSPSARRGEPPSPIPGDFSVEQLQQRGLVEEKPAPPGLVVPQKVGPGQQCVGSTCPAPAAASPQSASQEAVPPARPPCTANFCPR